MKRYVENFRSTNISLAFGCLKFLRVNSEESYRRFLTDTKLQSDAKNKFFGNLYVRIQKQFNFDDILQIEVYAYLYQGL